MGQKLKNPKMVVVETLADYHNLIQGDKVVVKVGADWCPPCHVQNEKIKDLDYDRVKDIKFAEVDADSFELSELFDEMGINAIPTLALYHKGNVLTKSTGIKGGWELYELFKAFDEYKLENAKTEV